MTPKSKNRITLIVGFPPADPGVQTAAMVLDVVALVPPGANTPKQLDLRVATACMRGWTHVTVLTLGRDGRKLRVHRPQFDALVTYKGQKPALVEGIRESD